MATKTSILVFYFALAKNEKVFKWASIGTLVIVNVAGLGLTFVNAFQCHPIWAEFQETLPSDTVCTDLVTLYLSSAPVNICTDLLILVLPIPVLTNMRLPRKQKIILIVTFSFGAFVAAVDVVRISYLEQAFQIRIDEVGQENATASRVTIQDDFSWYASLSFMWSAIEVHVGIICACVPSLKPLVARILPSLLRDTTNPRDNTGRQTSFTADRMLDSVDFAVLNQTATKPPASSQTAVPATSGEDGSTDARTRANDSPAPLDSTPQTAEEGMNMMEFLTTPDGVPPSAPVNRTSTTLTATTFQTSRTGSPTFFDFYNLHRRKPMTKLTDKESFPQVAFVTILFFLWGCAYGLLNILNSQFALVAKFTSNQSIGLHAAYYGGYAIGPFFPGSFIFKKLGFKATFIAGLWIYSIGTLVFWPSAVLVSFVAFVISNFVVGVGVSILELGANPFVALCGPPVHSETRLNISQGVQAIGTVVAPLLAQKVLFKNVTDAATLIDVQWTYLGISLFDVALAVVFLYLPINEASDEDFEKQAEKRQSVNSATLFGIKVVYITLALGVFSQFCYVGAQESASVYYLPYIEEVEPSSTFRGVDPFSYQTVGHTVFAVGRFLCAALQFIMKPRTVLSLLFIGMIITSALCMVLTGPSAIAVLTLYELFQSGVFPLIYAITLRGLGSFTKTGAILLTTAIAGGAIFPVIQNSIAASYSQRYAFCVVLAASAAGIVFPVYLEAVPKAKRQVDPVHLPQRGLPTTVNGSAEKGTRARSWSNKALWKFRRKGSRQAEVEHVEGGSSTNTAQ